VVTEVRELKTCLRKLQMDNFYNMCVCVMWIYVMMTTRQQTKIPEIWRHMMQIMRQSAFIALHSIFHSQPVVNSDHTVT